MARLLSRKNQIIFIWDEIHFFSPAGYGISQLHDDQDCNGNLVCTEEFRTVLINIVDGDGEPVSLDSYTVTNLDTEQVITLDPILWIDTYPIADDSMLDDIPKEGQRIELVGNLDGEEVVRETFLVGHDCCHVVLLEGETTIELTL